VCSSSSSSSSSGGGFYAVDPVILIQLIHCKLTQSLKNCTSDVSVDAIFAITL